MKRLETLEQMREAGAKYKDTNINQTFGQAYFSAREHENDLLDFHEVIWESDIDQIIANLDEFGITEFTISSTYSSLIETIAEFDKKGWKVTGLTEVNAPFTDFMTGGLKKIPAFKMQRA